MNVSRKWSNVTSQMTNTLHKHGRITVIMCGQVNNCGVPNKQAHYEVLVCVLTFQPVHSTTILSETSLTWQPTVELLYKYSRNSAVIFHEGFHSAGISPSRFRLMVSHSARPVIYCNFITVFRPSKHQSVIFCVRWLSLEVSGIDHSCHTILKILCSNTG